MTKVSYDNRSVYAKTPQTNLYVDYLEFWTPRTVPASPSDRLINLDNKYRYRPDLLSYDLYGTPQLWWIFAARNPDVIKDPVFDFVPGTIIYAPSTNIIGSYI